MNITIARLFKSKLTFLYEQILPGIAVPSLSDGKSNLLNVIRWMAALTVLIGHTELYSRFIYDDATVKANFIYYYLTLHAHIAVVVFFVLSGYLVGYATYRKLIIKRNDSFSCEVPLKASTYNFAEYFLDRWSRIYSVLLFAIVFTLVLDSIGASLSSNYLKAELIPQDHEILRLLINIFSLQGVQGYRVQLGSNPALWSIGYEFCYYMLFGLIIFKRNIFRRNITFVLSFVIISLLLGPNMMNYFIIWFLGFIVFLMFHQVGIKLPPLFILPLFLSLLIVNHFTVYNNIFGLSYFLQDLLFSLFVCLILLCESNNKLSGKYLVLFNKNMADFSYSIYSFHLPIIFMYYSIIAPKHHFEQFMYESILLIFICIVTAKILFYASEHQRPRFKAALKMLFQFIKLNKKDCAVLE